MNGASRIKWAAALANVAAQLPGEKVIAAHSLGNMVTSSAIADHQMQVSAYFMLNAAVPMETYDEGAVTDESSYNMANPDWHAYTNRLWASRWHEAWKRIDTTECAYAYSVQGKLGGFVWSGC